MDGSILFIVIVSLLYFFSSWRDTQFSKQDKKDYMRSEKWKQKRKLVLQRDGYCCMDCLSGDQLEVHHITYKRLGNEKLSDLATVCRSCHQKIHNKYGYNYQRNYPLFIDYRK